MAPFSPSLNTLRALLREVSDPADLPRGYARCLGEGSFVTAYRVGRFVVKGTGGEFGADADQWAEARKFDIRRAPTVLARLRYAECKIQVYRTPVRQVFTDAEWDTYCYVPKSAFSGSWPGGMDLHAANVGVDSRVRFIAFDW